MTSEPPGTAAGGALRAQAVLDRGSGPEVLAFDAVSTSTDDPARSVVARADRQGRTLTPVLPRQQVKRLLSWRTPMSLEARRAARRPQPGWGCAGGRCRPTA
jgi:hypothetical protein